MATQQLDLPKLPPSRRRAPWDRELAMPWRRRLGVFGFLELRWRVSGGREVRASVFRDREQLVVDAWCEDSRVLSCLLAVGRRTPLARGAKALEALLMPRAR